MAPREDLITPLGWAMIDSLPPILREDPDYRALMHCAAREIERVEATIEDVRTQLIPVNATDLGLQAWEHLLRLPVAPSGETIEVRQITVANRLAALGGDPAGTDWVRRMNRRLGNVAWSYEEHQPGVGGTPAAQTLRIRLPFVVNSEPWNQAVKAFREETPSELALTFLGEGGFILDASQLDLDTLDP